MIAIIDYGVGNLGSVEKAFRFIGSDAVITSDKKLILEADAVVLPGVGAYSDAMQSLRNADMIDTIKEVIRVGIPFLGICLGLQLLFEYSEEGGARVPGMGILKGAIKQLPLDMKLKVPHMGWNSLRISENCPLFKNLPAKPYVYFIHSFYLEAKDRTIVAATTHYGLQFDVAVGHKNIYATQFHPEKSGEIGLGILKNFVEEATKKVDN